MILIFLIIILGMGRLVAYQHQARGRLKAQRKVELDLVYQECPGTDPAKRDE